MAMRGRGGRVNPNRPPRLITGRVYEDFKPMSEWRQEDGYDTLLLYLPGFQKEYIKVTTEEVNIVRVRGERLIVDNKWSRFQEDYRVPENCEMKGIRAKLDGGILTITMPRKTTTAPSPPPPPPSPPPPPPPSPPPPPPPPPPPSPPPPPPPAALLPPKTNEQPIKRTNQEEVLPNPKQEPKLKKPQTTSSYTLPPHEPKPTSSYTQTKHNVVGGLDKGKEALVNHEEDNKRSWMMNEDRKALVNVGVSVLVIVALGIHVSYTIGLLSKGK